MDNRILVIVADEDKSTLEFIEQKIKQINKNIAVLSSQNGRDAWFQIEKFKPKIVIANLDMPVMDGVQLLIKIKSNKDYNDIYFIGLVTQLGQKKMALAMDKNIDEFLRKPILPDEFETRVNAALKVTEQSISGNEEGELLIQLADELDNTINDIVKMSYQIIRARMPQYKESIKDAAHAAVWIAEKYGDFDNDEIRDIEIAAFLAQSGRMFLPDSYLEQPIMVDGKATHKIMYRVPVCARDIISSVSRFNDIANIVFHMYENIDGSGFPDRLQSWQIPFASRIIRVPMDFQQMLYNSNDTPGVVMSKIRQQSTRVYDHRIVELMDQYVHEILKENFAPGEKAVQIADLDSGMMLARDIITDKGLKLMSAGAVLQPKQIEKIISHDTSDPILGNIYVQKRK